MQWLIVGAGIHGTIISHALLRFSNLNPSDIQIVDPHPSPLAAWNRRITNCGMQFLRSPAAHGVVPEFASLRAWASANGFHEREFRPPYARPSVKIFREHSAWAIERSGLPATLRRGTVVGLQRAENHWVATLADGQELAATNVVLATGRSDTGAAPLLRVPDWAATIGVEAHVLSEQFDRSRFERAANPLVVGAGATAVHFAVSVARSGRPVRMLTRHQLRIHQFDSEPCFIGPRCYERFLREQDPERRREMIALARHPGSVPGDLAAELTREQGAGRITVIRDEISRLEHNGGRHTLCGSLGRYESDAVALATGFESATPSEILLKQVQQIYGDSCARDQSGRPIPDSSLQWGRGLFLTGTLAEQELGPTAPNIIGAHNAAKRIIAYLSGRKQPSPRSWQHYTSA